jgi:hypothetical protein
MKAAIGPVQAIVDVYLLVGVGIDGAAVRAASLRGDQMNEFEQLVREVRGFATEVRRLGYSSAANENPFVELSERMVRHADQAEQRSR